jgi:hypothetical protein
MTENVTIDLGISTVRQMPCTYASTRCTYCYQRIAVGELIDWTPDRPRGERAKHPSCPWPIISAVGAEMLQRQAADLARRRLAQVAIQVLKMPGLDPELARRVAAQLVAAPILGQPQQPEAQPAQPARGQVVAGPWQRAGGEAVAPGDAVVR